MTLTIAHPDHFRSERLQGLPWVYVDGKMAIYRRLEQRLNAKSRLISAREFNNRASALQRPFLEWADSNVGIGDKREWIVTPLHRNPFGNDIQLHLTWMILLAERCSLQDILVLTESCAFLDTLRANPVFGETRISAFCEMRLRLGALRRKLRALASMLIRAMQIVAAVAVARFSIGSPHLQCFGQIDVLMERYIHERDLGGKSGYDDPYAPGLAEWFVANGVRVGFLAHRYRFEISKISELFSTMRDSPRLILPFERLLSFRDCAVAVVASLRYALRPMKPPTAFAALSLGPLLRAERPVAALHAFTGLLHLAIPRRLAQLKIAPAIILDWCENQQVDRAMALAMAENPQGPRLAAFRQYALFSGCSSLYVSDRAVRQGAAPAVCYVSGRMMATQLGEYDKTTEYHVVPAFRYAYLHHASSADLGLAQRDRILVILTHSDEENYGILSSTFEAVRSLAALPKMTIRIRPHPNVSTHAVSSVLAAEWPWIADYALIERAAGSLAEDLAATRLAVTSGSSAALEAVCRGVPVVIVGRPAGLGMNPMDGVDSRLWQEIFTTEEMAVVLRSWSVGHPLSLAQRLCLGESVRDMFFEAFSAAAAAPLLAAAGKTRTGGQQAQPGAEFTAH